jgi:hypothetical protein
LHSIFPYICSSQKLLHFLTLVVARSIPNQHQPLSGTLLLEMLDKSDCISSIAGTVLLHDKFLRVSIQGSIVGLPLFLITDGKFNSEIALSPHIPAHITSEQMTLI